MNQIFELLANSIINFIIINWHEILCIQNTNLSTVLERMTTKAHCKYDATQHPHINICVYFIFQIFINHFWGSVHHRGIFFKIIKLIIYRFTVSTNGIVVQYLLGCWSEITKSESLFRLVKEDVFNFNISMLNAILMHVLQTLAYVNKNVNNLLLFHFTIIFQYEIKKCAACT